MDIQRQVENVFGRLKFQVREFEPPEIEPETHRVSGCFPFDGLPRLSWQPIKGVKPCHYSRSRMRKTTIGTE